jgi:hypothetical protein
MSRTDPRPRVLDDKELEQVAKLATIQCTEAEIAQVLNISQDTWTRLKKRDKRVKEALENGRERGKASLRRLQWEQAQNGNTGMLVWLGKQYLGQTDKQDLGGAGGGPILLKVIYERKRENTKAALQ